MSETENKSVDMDQKVEKVYDKLIDSAYAIGTKMPLTGPVTKKAFDAISLRENAKKVAKVMFNPFYLYGKIKAARKA